MGSASFSSSSALFLAGAEGGGAGFDSAAAEGVAAGWSAAQAGATMAHASVVMVIIRCAFIT